MEVSNTGTVDFLDAQKMNSDEALSYQVNMLLLAREGTIPGSRNFGLRQDYLSAPAADIALNALGIELQEKIGLYIDDVEVGEIRGEADTDGHLNAVVTVERR